MSDSEFSDACERELKRQDLFGREAGLRQGSKMLMDQAKEHWARWDIQEAELLRKMSIHLDNEAKQHEIAARAVPREEEGTKT